MFHSRYMIESNHSYAHKAKSAVVSPGSGEQAKLFSINLLNMTGNAMDMAAFIKRDNTFLDFYQVDAANTPDATLNNAILSGTSTVLVPVAANSGFLIQHNKPFDVIGFNVSVGESIGDLLFYYYDGTAYQPLTTRILKNLDLTNTGEYLVMFALPQDFVPGTTAAVGGSTTKYSILAVSAAGAAVGPEADSIFIGKLLHFQPNVADEGNLEIRYSENFPKLLDANETINPYFENSSPLNMVTVQSFSQ